MKLYLAVAVLVLALAAHTEAQEPETIEEKLANFGTQVTEFGKDLAEKTKNAFQDLHNSEVATNTRSWFQRQLDSMKAKFEELSQK
ncbi:apolipoprotein C-I [Centroberyx affinis]|uniref:apolipoprotein C-I-like n=1 Tax=Centroberyx affinis TaxID=166261 RepID=UPI003A5BE1E1